MASRIALTVVEIKDGGFTAKKDGDVNACFYPAQTLNGLQIRIRETIFYYPQENRFYARQDNGVYNDQQYDYNNVVVEDYVEVACDACRQQYCQCPDGAENSDTEDTRNFTEYIREH